MKALASICVCTDSPKPSLLVDAISTEFFCTGPYYIWYGTYIGGDIIFGMDPIRDIIFGMDLVRGDIYGVFICVITGQHCI